MNPRRVRDRGQAVVTLIAPIGKQVYRQTKTSLRQNQLYRPAKLTLQTCKKLTLQTCKAYLQVVVSLITPRPPVPLCSYLCVCARAWAGGGDAHYAAREEEREKRERERREREEREHPQVVVTLITPILRSKYPAVSAEEQAREIRSERE